MMQCKCVSCCISRALEQGKIPKGLSDLFLLGYHYYAMTHVSTEDAGWYAEGVDFYMQQVEKDYPSQGQVKTLLKIIKEAKE